jgi:hypothetical protein
MTSSAMVKRQDELLVRRVMEVGFPRLLFARLAIAFLMSDPRCS